MRIVTRLARTEFHIGSITREGDTLVLESHPDQAMKVKAYIYPSDVTTALRAGVNYEVVRFLAEVIAASIARKTRGASRRKAVEETSGNQPANPSVPLSERPSGGAGSRTSGGRSSSADLQSFPREGGQTA